MSELSNQSCTLEEFLRLETEVRKEMLRKLDAWKALDLQLEAKIPKTQRSKMPVQLV